MKTAKLIAAVATTQAPFLVLADDNGTDPVRTQRRGPRPPEDGLSKDEWKIFAHGRDEIAQAVFDETGLRTVFHHHCAGYVRRRKRSTMLLDMTNPERLGLVFDTGHYVHGTGGEDVDLVAALDRFKERIWYIHMKDLEPNVARQSREKQWDYFTAMRNGLYPELGKGCVDFPALLRWLARARLQGLRAGGAGHSSGHGNAERERGAQSRVHPVN